MDSITVRVDSIPSNVYSFFWVPLPETHRMLDFPLFLSFVRTMTRISRHLDETTVDEGEEPGTLRESGLLCTFRTMQHTKRPERGKEGRYRSPRQVTRDLLLLFLLSQLPLRPCFGGRVDTKDIAHSFSIWRHQNSGF